MISDVSTNLLGALLAFAYADPDQLPGVAPSGETSADTDGISVRMPDGRPGGLQRQGSADSVMALDPSLACSPSPTPTAASPARVTGDPTHMDSPDRWLNGLQLGTLIEPHKIRKDPDTEVTDYIVSNLKFFTVEVVLVNSSKELVSGVNVGLSAWLVYEDGEDVVLRPDDKNTEILTGESKTNVVIIDGRGFFKLQMGPSVLSSTHADKLFRVKIAPSSERLRNQFPLLTVLSKPIKSMVKAYRKPSPSCSGGGGDRPSTPPPTEPPHPSLFPALGLACGCTGRKRSSAGQPVLVHPVAAAPRPSVGIMAAAPSVGIVANARAIPSLTELTEKSGHMLRQLTQLADSLWARIPGGNAER